MLLAVDLRGCAWVLDVLGGLVSSVDFVVWIDVGWLRLCLGEFAVFWV